MKVFVCVVFGGVCFVVDVLYGWICGELCMCFGDDLCGWFVVLVEEVVCVFGKVVVWLIGVDYEYVVVCLC